MAVQVLIDISYLAHRAWFTMGELSYGDKPTGIIFGVLEQIRSICFHPRIYSSRIQAFFDSKTSLRRDNCSDYKASRQEKRRTPEEWSIFLKIKEQVERLQDEILPSMGVTCHHQEGLEADDLLAKASEQIDSEPDGSTVRAVIISADSDLYQCVSDHIHLYDPNKRLYLVKGDIITMTGVTPRQWGLVKVLAGCSSDDVSGVPGVGEKTAVDYLRGLLPPSSSKYRMIVARTSRALIRRNSGLVLLPHKATSPVELSDPSYDAHGFFRMCRHLGFRSLLQGERRKMWLNFFGGLRSTQDRIRGRRTCGTER